MRLGTDRLMIARLNGFKLTARETDLSALLNNVRLAEQTQRGHAVTSQFVLCALCWFLVCAGFWTPATTRRSAG
jgi:hypothetical protein